MPYRPSFWQSLARGLTIASWILGSLVAGGVLGWLIEQWAPSFRPWGLLVGLVSGLILGSWQALRQNRIG